MSLFGPPNIKKLTAKRDVTGLIRALQYRDVEIRVLAADALGNLKAREAVPALIDVFRSVSIVDIERLKSPAKDALRKIGDAARAELLEALDAGDRRVRSWVARVFEGVCDGQVVEALIRRWDREDHHSVREDLIHVLSLTGDPRLTRVFVRVLAYREAEEGLVKIGQPAIPDLVALLASDDEDARARATGVLGKIGDGRVSETLVPCLDDPVANVRSAAAEALERLGWAPHNDQQRMSLLMARTDWAALEKLGEAAVEPLLRMFESDRSDDGCVPANEIRVPIASTLGAIGGERAVVVLTAAALGEDVLKKNRTYASGNTVNGWTKVTDVVIASVRALGRIGSANAVAALTRVASTKHDMAAEAIAAMTSILRQSAVDCTSDQLTALSRISSVKQSSYIEPPMAEQDVIVKMVRIESDVDLKELRELAAAELRRRAVEAGIA